MTNKKPDSFYETLIMRFFIQLKSPLSFDFLREEIEELQEISQKRQMGIIQKMIEKNKLEELQEDRTKYRLSSVLYGNHEDEEKQPKDKIYITSFLELAEEFHKINPFFFDGAGLWWNWDKNEKCYKIVDATDLLNEIDKYEWFKPMKEGIDKENKADWKLIVTTASTPRNEIVESLKRIGRLNIPKDIPKTWIQFKKWVVDIETNETFPVTSKMFATNPIPWDIGESEDTPTIDKIFTEWVGEKNKMMLYEIIAYSMLPDYPIHRFFVLNGSGLNGKSKYLELIRRIIGCDNCSSSELDVLTYSRFEPAMKLYKKLVCMMGETNVSTLKRTQFIKRATGQDIISYEFKLKGAFNDINYAKLILATNSLPITYDKTTGFYRRPLIIDFPNKFDEKIDILSTIPKKEYKNLVKKSISVLQKLLKRRTFTNEPTVEQKRERYELTSNPILRFIKQYCKEDVNADVVYADFYEKFCQFVKDEDVRRLTRHEVTELLTRDGYETKNKKTKTPEGKDTTRCHILGLSWKNGDTKKDIQKKITKV